MSRAVRNALVVCGIGMALAGAGMGILQLLWPPTQWDLLVCGIVLACCGIALTVVALVQSRRSAEGS